MKKLLTAVVLAGAALVPVATAAASSVPSAYLSIHSNTATFAQFTLSGSNIVGALTTTTLKDSVPNADLESITAPLTGTDDGGQLTLSVGGSAPEFGSLNGRSLSLQVPQSNGALSTVMFTRISVAAYNQYIARWQTAISNANAAARAAAAKAAASAAAAKAAAAYHQQLLNRLNQTIGTVEHDLATMGSPFGLSDDLNRLAIDLSGRGLAGSSQRRCRFAPSLR